MNYDVELQQCNICDAFRKEHRGIIFRYSEGQKEYHNIFYTNVIEMPKIKNKAASYIFTSEKFEHIIELPKFSIWKYILSLFWNENMF